MDFRCEARFRTLPGLTATFNASGPCSTPHESLRRFLRSFFPPCNESSFNFFCLHYLVSSSRQQRGRSVTLKPVLAGPSPFSLFLLSGESSFCLTPFFISINCVSGPLVCVPGSSPLFFSVWSFCVPAMCRVFHPNPPFPHQLSTSMFRSSLLPGFFFGYPPVRAR